MFNVKEIVNKIDSIENKINERNFHIDNLINDLKSNGFKEEEREFVKTKDNDIRKLITAELDKNKFRKIFVYGFISLLICTNNVYIGYYDGDAEYCFEKYISLDNNIDITETLLIYIENTASKVYGIY